MSVEQLLVRCLIALGLSLLGLAMYWGWNRFQLRRLGRVGASRLRGLESFQPGMPGILYFTTPDCQVCITAQKPALRRLEAEMGDGVQIVEIDATAEPGLADYWGVLTVPTTFIIDAKGQPHHINHGLTSKDKLRRQIVPSARLALSPRQARPPRSRWPRARKLISAIREAANERDFGTH